MFVSYYISSPETLILSFNILHEIVHSTAPIPIPPKNNDFIMFHAPESSLESIKIFLLQWYLLVTALDLSCTYFKLHRISTPGKLEFHIFVSYFLPSYQVKKFHISYRFHLLFKRVFGKYKWMVQTQSTIHKPGECGYHCETRICGLNNVLLFVFQSVE